MRTLILIPTYNEKDNIAPLIQAIVTAYDASSVKAKAELSILVIDDNSPDGTADVVRGLNHPRVNLLSRPGKQGLGKAYLAGFDWGLKQGYDALIEMDADFSHRPVDLMRLIHALLDGADFAVGSRYVDGGGTQNWGLMRKVISRGGSLYSRLILGHPLGDWTGGFNAWK